MRRANAAPNWRRISDRNRNQENEEGKELKNDFVILSNDLSVSIIYSMFQNFSRMLRYFSFA